MSSSKTGVPVRTKVRTGLGGINHNSDSRSGPNECAPSSCETHLNQVSRGRSQSATRGRELADRHQAAQSRVRPPFLLMCQPC